MPLRVKLTDRFQKRLSEWARKRKPFKNKQELEEKFGQALKIWQSSKTRQHAENLLSEQGKLEHFLHSTERNGNCLVCLLAEISLRLFQA